MAVSRFKGTRRDAPASDARLLFARGPLVFNVDDEAAVRCARSGLWMRALASVLLVLLAVVLADPDMYRD